MRMRKFKLLIDLPFFQKDDEFWMQDRDGHVYWIEDGKTSKYPLRQGLAGYLWLLCTEDCYMKFLEKDYDD